jgi:hypothetical protein
MIVDDLHFVCFSVDPAKYDSPLVVNPNGMKTFEVAPQLFQSICRRHTQVFKPSSDVNGDKLSLCPIGESMKGTDEFVFEKRLCSPVAKRPDHTSVYRIPVYDQ